jgi:uncharacterized protein (TIGR03086 family)
VDRDRSGTNDIVALHGRALDSASALVGRVRAAQMGASTPCEGWDLRTLLAHLVGGNRRYAALAQSSTPLWRDQGAGTSRPTPDEILELDPAGAYRASAEALRAAWSATDRLSQRYELPFGRLPGREALAIHLLETVAHGWDLARATGQEPGFDADVVRAAWDVARRSLSGERPPGSPFAPAVITTEATPEIDRLAAFLGRRA